MEVFIIGSFTVRLRMATSEELYHLEFHSILLGPLKEGVIEREGFAGEEFERPVSLHFDCAEIATAGESCAFILLSLCPSSVYK